MKDIPIEEAGSGVPNVLQDCICEIRAPLWVKKAEKHALILLGSVVRRERWKLAYKISPVGISSSY